MYGFTITIHIIVSALFVIVGLLVLVMAVVGLVKPTKFTKANNFLSVVFLMFLYVQLVLGIVLYYFLGSSSGTGVLSNQDELINNSLRYWVVSHFSVMIFTLALSQLGRMFIINNIQDKQKFKNTIFFYGVSYVLIIISAVLGMIR